MIEKFFVATGVLMVFLIVLLVIAVVVLSTSKFMALLYHTCIAIFIGKFKARNCDSRNLL